MSTYELAILGDAEKAERERLERTLVEMLEGFGLTDGVDFAIRTGPGIGDRDIRSAAAALYFGGASHADLEVARELVRAGVPVIPCIGPADDLLTTVPDFLRDFNGLRRCIDDLEMAELV